MHTDGPALVAEEVDDPVEEDPEEEVDEEVLNDDVELDAVWLLDAEEATATFEKMELALEVTPGPPVEIVPEGPRGSFSSILYYTCADIIPKTGHKI